jgi:hypothetical protein
MPNRMPNLKCIAYEVVRFEGYEVVRRTFPAPPQGRGVLGVEVLVITNMLVRRDYIDFPSPGRG